MKQKLKIILFFIAVFSMPFSDFAKPKSKAKGTANEKGQNGKKLGNKKTKGKPSNRKLQKKANSKASRQAFKKGGKVGAKAHGASVTAQRAANKAAAVAAPVIVSPAPAPDVAKKDSEKVPNKAPEKTERPTLTKEKKDEYAKDWTEYLEKYKAKKKEIKQAKEAYEAKKVLKLKDRESRAQYDAKIKEFEKQLKELKNKKTAMKNDLYAKGYEIKIVKEKNDKKIDFMDRRDFIALCVYDNINPKMSPKEFNKIIEKNNSLLKKIKDNKTVDTEIKSSSFEDAKEYKAYREALQRFEKHCNKLRKLLIVDIKDKKMKTEETLAVIKNNMDLIFQLEHFKENITKIKEKIASYEFEENNFPEDSLMRKGMEAFAKEQGKSRDIAAKKLNTRFKGTASLKEVEDVRALIESASIIFDLPQKPSKELKEFHRDFISYIQIHIEKKSSGSDSDKSNIAKSVFIDRLIKLSEKINNANPEEKKSQYCIINFRYVLQENLKVKTELAKEVVTALGEVKKETAERLVTRAFSFVKKVMEVSEKILAKETIDQSEKDLLVAGKEAAEKAIKAVEAANVVSEKDLVLKIKEEAVLLTKNLEKLAKRIDEARLVEVKKDDAKPVEEQLKNNQLEQKQAIDAKQEKQDLQIIDNQNNDI